MSPGLLAVLAALAAAPGTIAGTVTVKAKTGAEKADRSEVVIYLADVSQPASGARAAIRQEGRQFIPRVLVVAAGTEVDFPNHDGEEHNVFSHSAAADFDLGRFGQGRSKARVFSDPGVVEIFCNVHKEMIAYLVIAPSRFATVTGPDGRFELEGVPPGSHRLVVWERFARPRVRELQVDVPAGHKVDVPLTVNEQIDTEPPHKNKQGVDYPAGYR